MMAATMRIATGLAALLVAACANNPPPPDWQKSARVASERAVAAYLVGNARAETVELARARNEVARTGRADLMARVELTHCAAQVASLVFGPCAGFEALRADTPAASSSAAQPIVLRIMAIIMAASARYLARTATCD